MREVDYHVCIEEIVLQDISESIPCGNSIYAIQGAEAYEAN